MPRPTRPPANEGLQFSAKESVHVSTQTVLVHASADLVLLSANPLDDIRNTQKINVVIAHGRLFDRAALDQILMKVEAAAKRQK